MIKTCTYKIYCNKFNDISNIINKDLLFKVNKPDHNNLNTYFIHERGAACITLVNYNTIELRGLIAYNGGGTALLNHIIKRYNKRYNIILDSFISNDKFYKKFNFMIYKHDPYNSKYDPAGLNKNKEGVNYYILEAAV